MIATEDPLVSSTIEAALRERGVEVFTGTSIERFDGTTAHLGDGRTIADVDHGAAGGRSATRSWPTSGSMPPASSTRNAGIVADTFGRTNVDGIYAVGDVTGNTLDDARRELDRAARRSERSRSPTSPRSAAPRALPNAVFCRPRSPRSG